ncbi:MAG TPA: TIGR03118 family protein, partial [Micromonosporaceae bacterium]|nr:TIGR03118 family protein [Micromonosporaceae bacterium]
MFRVRRLVAVGAVPLLLLAAAPASADPITAGFTEIKQVANLPGNALFTDPNAVNSWGLALSPTSPIWSANNGTNTATLYTGGLNGATVGKAGLTVTIDSDGPTGQVFNGTGKFVVPGGASAPFIFDTESGDVAAWSPPANATHALVMAHVAGAVFKGLALWNTANGPFLLATDFAQGRVDVFDSAFTQVDLDGALFRDPDLPKGYAPFNVMTVGDQVYVTYAKQQAGSDDEAHGPGLGVVDVYTDGGTTVHRVSTHGRLNAPW